MRRPMPTVLGLLLVAGLLLSVPGTARAAHGAPCSYARTYAGMTLECYGAKVTVQGRRAPFWVTFPAKQTSDGRKHRAHVHAWTESTIDFHLDGETNPRVVVCSIPLWGGACQFVYG